MGQKPLGKFFKCSSCGKPIWKKPSKTYKEKFCRNTCYFKWKRKYPNKKAYLPKIFVSGYWYLYKPGHPNAIKNGRYIAEHRFVLEQKIGRYLSRNEISHHKNHNKEDNRPENLELMTISEHNRQHALKRRRKQDGKF